MWKKIIACFLFVILSSYCFSQSVSIQLSQISEIRTQLAALKTQLKQNEILRLDLNTQIENLDKTLTNYIKLTQDLKNQLEILNEQKKDLMIQIINLEEKLKNYEGLVKGLNQEIDIVEKELKKLKRSLIVWKTLTLITAVVAGYKIAEDVVGF